MDCEEFRVAGWVHGLLERAARAVAEGWPA